MKIKNNYMRLYEITFRYKGDTMITEVKADNKDQARQRLVNYNEVDEVLEVEEIGELLNY